MPKSRRDLADERWGAGSNAAPRTRPAPPPTGSSFHNPFRKDLTWHADNHRRLSRSAAANATRSSRRRPSNRTASGATPRSVTPSSRQRTPKPSVSCSSSAARTRKPGTTSASTCRGEPRGPYPWGDQTDPRGEQIGRRVAPVRTSHGAKRVRSKPERARRVYTIRSCRRLGRPCQNSKRDGASK